MNVEQTVNISTNIHNERIKTKYIPSYIFENEGKLFKKKRKLLKLIEFPENLRCSNINGAMHKLLVGEKRKASVNKNSLVCIY